MNWLILASLALPLNALGLIFVTPNNNKTKITTISMWSSAALGIVIATLIGLWTKYGSPTYEFEWPKLYGVYSYRFPALLYFDFPSALYLLGIWLISFVIVKYSQHHLRGEAEYKRFTLVIFGFVFGLNLTILAGSINILFAGWEITGMSSLLMITLL